MFSLNLLIFRFTKFTETPFNLGKNPMLTSSSYSFMFTISYTESLKVLELEINNYSSDELIF